MKNKLEKHRSEIDMLHTVIGQLTRFFVSCARSLCLEEFKKMFDQENTI